MFETLKLPPDELKMDVDHIVGSSTVDNGVSQMLLKLEPEH